MNPPRYGNQQPQRSSEDQSKGTERPRPQTHPKEQPSKTEHDSRAFMHPSHDDLDWRYYFGAMGG